MRDDGSGTARRARPCHRYLHYSPRHDPLTPDQVQAAVLVSRRPNYTAVSASSSTCIEHPNLNVPSTGVPALGAKVTAHYNNQRGPLLPLLQTYPTLHIIQADLADEAAVVDLFTTLSRSDAGPVQVLVVNHAIADMQRVPVAEMSLARWNRIITTNLTSAFLVCREYLKHLKQASSEAKDKAAIVLVGSTAGKYGEAGNADYAVTKSGASDCNVVLRLRSSCVRGVGAGSLMGVVG